MATVGRVAASALRQSVISSCYRRQALQSSVSRVRTVQQLQQRVPRPAFVPIRWHSAPSTRSKVYQFEDMKKLSEAPSSDRILIDVREPSEYEAGYIPGAINVPIKSQPDAMFLPEEEFEDRFGFSKPPMDSEVVFYCKAGVRSSAAAQLAQQQGYKNVAEYRGSWLDWQKQGGQESKP